MPGGFLFLCMYLSMTFGHWGWWQSSHRVWQAGLRFVPVPRLCKGPQQDRAEGPGTVSARRRWILLDSVPAPAGAGAGSRSAGTDGTDGAHRSQPGCLGSSAASWHRRQRCQAQGCSRLAPCSPRASIPGSKSMLLPVCLRLRESVPVTALASSGRWGSKDESLVRSLVYFLLLLDMGGTKWSDMRRFLLEILITFKLSGLSIIHLPFFGFKPLAVLFLLIVWDVLGL